MSLLNELDAALPQTQCTRCGYPDCHSYAQAMAQDHTPANQCPPGGQEGVERLSALLRRPVIPLNPAHGTEGPRHVAIIDETWCIGCTLCLQACPVDSIMGAHQRMHTVLESACTGCELCLPACPVDCIEMVNISGHATGWDAWSPARAKQAKHRYQQHQARLAREAHEHAQHMAQKAAEKLSELQSDPAQSPSEHERKRQIVQAALARHQAKIERKQPPKQSKKIK